MGMGYEDVWLMEMSEDRVQ